MRFEKKETQKNINKNLISSISKEYGLEKEIVEILLSRGYTTKKEITSFLEPQNFNYYNPFLLRGMDEAVKIIKGAVAEKKRITILGDYDTDGICSTSIMVKYFESVGIKANYFLPNRFVDGYGLTFETVDKIINKFNPELLITVDCGISSYAEIEYAKSKGVQVIVTDHHEVPENEPNCVVINPKLKKQEYPFSDLCGAGVALKVVQALAGYEFANRFVSIASFATIADIVPLTDENRAIVYNGIKNYKKDLPVGVLRLIEQFNIKNLTPSDVSFRVAPKINTAGRMGDASLAYKLFELTDENEIKNQITELLNLNEIRVSDGLEIYDEAIEMLQTKPISEMRAIVLYKDDWNGGVLGIICAKLVEKYNKPVFLFSKIDNEYKGSARSIGNIDIYKEMSKLSDLLIRFGGHSQAGGLSIHKENFDIFEKRLNENLFNNYREKDFEQVKYFDLDLDKFKLTDSFLKQLRKLEPFGFGNEKPVFKLTINQIKATVMKNFDNHLKMRYGNLDIVAFNYAHYLHALNSSSKKEILIDLNLDFKYRNRNLVNAKLLSVKMHELNVNLPKEIVNVNTLKQLKFINQKKKAKHTDIFADNYNKVIEKTIKSSHFGNLIITTNFNNYKKFIQEFQSDILNYEMLKITSKTAENTIIYLPKIDDEITGFKNVLLLEPPLCDGYLNLFEESDIYVFNTLDKSRVSIFKNLNIERKVFGTYHNAIVNFNKSQQLATGEYDFFVKMSRFNPQFKSLKYDQFVFVLLVLNELQIFNIEKGEHYKVMQNIGVKNDLENSKIYNYVKMFKKPNKK